MIKIYYFLNRWRRTKRRATPGRPLLVNTGRDDWIRTSDPLLPKQRRTFGYASLPCTYQTDTSSKERSFQTFQQAYYSLHLKRAMAIAHLRKSSKYAHSAPVPEAEAYAHFVSLPCAPTYQRGRHPKKSLDGCKLKLHNCFVAF